MLEEKNNRGLFFRLVSVRTNFSLEKLSCTRPTSEGICFAKQSEQWLTETTAQSGEASESVPQFRPILLRKWFWFFYSTKKFSAFFTAVLKTLFYLKLYFLFGFFGNQPFSTLFSCSYNSWMLQKQEMPKMARLPERNREERKRLAIQANKPMRKNSQAIFLLK